MGDATRHPPAPSAAPRSAARPGGSGAPTAKARDIKSQVEWGDFDRAKRLRWCNGEWLSVDAPGFCRQQVLAVFDAAEQCAANIRGIGCKNSGIMVLGWTDFGGGKVLFFDPFTSDFTSDLVKKAAATFHKAVKHTVEIETAISVVEVCRGLISLTNSYAVPVRVLGRIDILPSRQCALCASLIIWVRLRAQVDRKSEKKAKASAATAQQAATEKQKMKVRARQRTLHQIHRRVIIDAVAEKLGIKDAKDIFCEKV